MIRTIKPEEAAAFAFSNDTERITFYKMRQLLRKKGALLLSDGQDVLFVRAGQGFPAWIYTRKGVSDETLSELAASICVLKEANNLAGVIGRASLVRYLELSLPFPSKRRLPLTAYLCEKPNRFSAEGERIPAGKKSVAFSLTMRADDQTLTDDHAGETVDMILKALGEKYGAVIR